MPRFVGVYLKKGRAAPLSLEGIYPFLFSDNRFPGVISTDGKTVYGYDEGAEENSPMSDIGNYKGSVAVSQATYNDSRPFVSLRLPGMGRKRAIVSVSGDITNTEEFVKELEGQGPVFPESGSDRYSEECISYIVTTEGKGSLSRGMENAVKRLKGYYNAIVAIGEDMVVFRSREGTFPLCYAKSGNDYIFAPETVAFGKINQMIDSDFMYEADVQPGELITLSRKGIAKVQVFEPEPSNCIRYMIFYAVEGSKVFGGQDVSRYRNETGKNLARENTSSWKDIDVLCLNDDSPEAASGFAQISGIRTERIIAINPRIAKSHDTTDMDGRMKGMNRKYHVISERARGKVGFVVDSLREGVEAGVKGKILKDAGADNVTLFVASPPTTRNCKKGRGFDIMGSDVPEQIKELKSYGIDDIRFLSSEGMKSPLERPADFCTECYSELFGDTDL